MDKIQLWQEAFDEVMAEEYGEVEQQNSLRSNHSFTFGHMVDEFAPIPESSLMFGVAGDGLPILLNCDDSIPKSLLTIGKSGSGKTNFLKVIAESINYAFGKRSFSVITTNRNEWSRFSGEYESLFTFGQTGADDLILSMAGNAHSTRRNGMRFLLIDGMEHFDTLDIETISNLKWLLNNGASRGTWVIATGSDKLLRYPIMDFFPTKVANVNRAFFMQEGLYGFTRFSVPISK